MRNKHRRWKLSWILITILHFSSCQDSFSSSTEPANLKNLFSPRMDYEQWKPIGRGDPLKNDPTYDYVPPVLDRVHYWVDPALRTPDPPMPVESQNPKTEILLLGVSSKKPATGSAAADSRRDTYDPYVKYIGGAQNQRISRPSFLPPIFPSLYSFGSKNNKYSDRAGHSKGSEQRVPYTVLMPPPVVTKNSQPNELVPITPVTQKPLPSIAYSTEANSATTGLPTSAATSVTIQSSNLVYHSSSSSDGHEFKEYSTVSSPNSWQATSAAPFREQLVFGSALTPPESYIRIEFSPSQNYSSNLLDTAGTNQKTNYVTPPPLASSEKIMFKKGHVSDDDDISNSYVKIGKPEAEVHSSGIGVSNMRDPPTLVLFPHAKPFSIPVMIPSTMQKIEDMQTMQPPPMTMQNSMYHKMTSPRDTTTTSSTTASRKPDATNFIGSSSSITNIYVTNPSTSVSNSTTTTTPPSTATKLKTTTMPTLTTDPLFKHYKQPKEPLKGPLYLIIQGHSKVKTYGPTKQMHGIPIQETNEISDESVDTSFEVRHLHGFTKNNLEDDGTRKARSGDLQTLKHVVQTGFGAIDLSDEEIQKRSDQDFQESELHVGYEVGEDLVATTEKYYRGIVEEARKLKQ